MSASTTDGRLTADELEGVSGGHGLLQAGEIISDIKSTMIQVQGTIAMSGSNAIHGAPMPVDHAHSPQPEVMTFGSHQNEYTEVTPTVRGVRAALTKTGPAKAAIPGAQAFDLSLAPPENQASY